MTMIDEFWLGIMYIAKYIINPDLGSVDKAKFVVQAIIEKIKRRPQGQPQWTFATPDQGGNGIQIGAVSIQKHWTGFIVDHCAKLILVISLS